MSDTWDPVRSTDHVARGIAKLTEQFRGKPVIEAELTAYLNQVQALESAVWEVVDARPTEAAIGVGLDMQGAIVGRGRTNLDDATYYRLVQAQILANRSSGEPDVTLHVFELATPSGTTAEYSEGGEPACVRLDTFGPFAVAATWPLLVLTKSAGVRLLLSYSPDEDPAEDFAFDGTGDAEGFGSVYDAAIGGKLRGCFNA